MISGNKAQPSLNQGKPMDWEQFKRLVRLSESGREEEAILGLRKLIGSSENREDDASVMLTIGACEKDLGRLEDARKTLAAARSLAEQGSWIHPRSLFFEASIDLSEGKWNQALDKLELLNSQFFSFLNEPENRDLFEEVRRKRGIALYELRRPSEACQLLHEAVTVEYERPTSLYYLGRCRYDLGDLEGAKQALRAALTLDLHPLYQPSAHYMLGLIHYHQGQHAWAIREYEWCLEHDEQGLEPKRKILTALVLASKALGMEEAAERYSKMLNVN